MGRSSQFGRIDAFPLLTGKSNQPYLSQCAKSPLVKLGPPTEKKYIAYKVAQMKELDMTFRGVKPMVNEKDILNISLARKEDGR